MEAWKPDGVGAREALRSRGEPASRDARPLPAFAWPYGNPPTLTPRWSILGRVRPMFATCPPIAGRNGTKEHKRVCPKVWRPGITTDESSRWVVKSGPILTTRPVAIRSTIPDQNPPRGPPRIAGASNFVFFTLWCVCQFSLVGVGRNLANIVFGSSAVAGLCMWLSWMGHSHRVRGLSMRPVHSRCRRRSGGFSITSLAPLLGM